ncbi:hypothetical protein [Streptomyces sp. KL116D]|uniref:hypothetical protein n=1 Tax=Streptomyces sp. KL116D TaxID=3045152 RepID=UPI0035565B31
MNLYKSSGFLAAMEQEVAESTKTSRRHRRQGQSPRSWRAQLDGSTTRETLTTYLKEITPITVIRLLMDTLRKEDNVVDVDLTTGRLTPPGASRTCSPRTPRTPRRGRRAPGRRFPCPG